MATKQRIDIDVVVQNQRRIDALERSLGRTTKASLNLGQAAKVAAGAIAAIGVGRGIRSLIDVGKEVEGLSLRFKFLFGSAEEGARAFDTLNQFAGRVPFSLGEIAAASGNLAVVAKDATELNEILEITGNVAAIAGLDFRTTGEQIQRAFSGGIASADIFREKGIRSLLGFKEGATVSIEETIAAFKRVFGKGGEFGNATDEFANTLEGTISMLGDKLRRFQEAAAGAFFETLKTELGDLNDFFDANAVKITEFGETVGEALGNAVIFVSKAIKTLKENIDILMVALGAFIGMKVAATFISIGTAVASATVAIRAFNLAAMAGPAGLLIGAIVGGVTVFKMFNKELDDGKTGLEDYGDGIDFSTGKTEELAKVTQGLTETQRDQFKTLQNINAQYVNHRVVLPEITAREKGLQKAIEDTVVSYDNLKKANASFVQSILLLGETQTEQITRQEEERNKRLDELYKQNLISYKELEELKSKVAAEAQRQRDKIAEEAARKEQARHKENIDLIRAGKIHEIDIENVTQEQKKDIIKEAGRSILEQSATFSKKAFEAYKAVQIAEALIGSRQAIIQSYKSGAKIGGPILGAVFAAAAGAATLAQVNAIRAQTFPGRERGGPVSRNRGYIVGEGGPELFTPGQSGMITPNNMLGQTDVTINFNVNAVDATSFDNLLQQRRDVIVGVVNQAMNERGRRGLTA